MSTYYFLKLGFTHDALMRPGPFPGFGGKGFNLFEGGRLTSHEGIMEALSSSARPTAASLMGGGPRLLEDRMFTLESGGAAQPGGFTTKGFLESLGIKDKGYQASFGEALGGFSGKPLNLRFHVERRHARPAVAGAAATATTPATAARKQVLPAANITGFSMRPVQEVGQPSSVHYVPMTDRPMDLPGVQKRWTPGVESKYTQPMQIHKRMSKAQRGVTRIRRGVGSLLKGIFKGR